jgi:large subunit ribosomal protein L4
MTSVDVKNVRGEVVGSLELDDRVFGVVPNKAVVHQAVVAQLANQRKGSADTKTRGEVRGGTHKMWRQKGTGRARQGDRRAPHWVGGGVVFGPHPRSYHQDLPRKMRRIAMRSALSSLLSESAVTIIDDMVITAAKTREVQAVLTALGLKRGALIVVAERDESIARASRNLEDVRTVTPGSLNLLDVLKHRHLILTKLAVEAITSQLVAEIRRGKGDAEATESGAAVPMSETAAADVATGTSPDVAEANAAESVASEGAADEDTKEGA